MPIPMVDSVNGASPASSVQVNPSGFPARTKQATGLIKGVRTEIMTMSFTDKILVTIAQDGRLAHWVCVEPVVDSQQEA